MKKTVQKKNETWNPPGYWRYNRKQKCFSIVVSFVRKMPWQVMMTLPDELCWIAISCGWIFAIPEPQGSAFAYQRVPDAPFLKRKFFPDYNDWHQFIEWYIWLQIIFCYRVGRILCVVLYQVNYKDVNFHFILLLWNRSCRAKYIFESMTWKIFGRGNFWIAKEKNKWNIVT